MSECAKCGRKLPANGTCFYCGSYKLDDKPIKKGSLLGAWASKLIRTLLALSIPALAIFLIFTDAGNDILRKIKSSIGIGFPRDNDSEAVKILRQQVPAVDQMVKDNRPGSVKFPQETKEDGTVQVTVLHQANDKLFSASFLVDLPTKTVRPLDDSATKLMPQ